MVGKKHGNWCYDDDFDQGEVLYILHIVEQLQTSIQW